MGWRGFALPRLQHRFGWLTASLIVGVIWAGVHLPLWLIPDFGFAGQSVPLYFIQVTALSVMLAWLYNATGRSLLATTLAHAAANGWTILWGAALQGVPDQAPAIATQPLLTAATVGLALLVLFADRSRRAPTPSVARALLPVRPPTKQARGGDTSPLTDQPSG